MSNIVELENVAKIYIMGGSEVYALRNVNLKIHKGDFTAILGPSGSGKSTLLNMIGCLDVPSSGIVRIDGNDTSTLSDDALTLIRRDKIGFIFQQFNLIPTLTGLENIELPLMHSKENTKRRERANQLLDLVGIERKFGTHKPSELSGGQQQRIAIARAIANNPQIILADEPTGNLDTASGTGIMELLKGLNQEGTTVVIVTHDPRLIDYSKKTVKMIDGAIAEEKNVA